MLRWLRVVVRRSLASDEKMEFTSDANALGADVGILFTVDRFNQIHLDGGTQAFSSVCWTRDHERLRAFISVFGLSELQFTGFA